MTGAGHAHRDGRADHRPRRPLRRQAAQLLKYGNYEGRAATAEPPHGLYCIDGQDDTLSRLSDAIDGPNGLAFSPDECTLDVAESRAQPRRILAFDIGSDGRRLGRCRVLIERASLRRGRQPLAGWGLAAG